jgi:hypothetical protein
MKLTFHHSTVLTSVSVCSPIIRLFAIRNAWEGPPIDRVMGQALGFFNLFRPVGMHHNLNYAGSIKVFSRISCRHCGHFAGSSRM